MEIYRFRTINSLLGEHQELEKQSIYFAKKEELNDPIEDIMKYIGMGIK